MQKLLLRQLPAKTLFRRSGFRHIFRRGLVAQFDYLPILLTFTAPRDRQLVWGRYADTPLATDRLALGFKEASSKDEFQSEILNTGFSGQNSVRAALPVILGLWVFS